MVRKPVWAAVSGSCAVAGGKPPAYCGDPTGQEPGLLRLAVRVAQRDGRDGRYVPAVTTRVWRSLRLRTPGVGAPIAVGST